MLDLLGIFGIIKASLHQYIGGRYMARIRAKKKKNSTYYYLVESRRSGPNKSPREHILEYIGTLDNLIEFAAKQYNTATSKTALPDSLSFKAYEHGAEIAMFHTAELLNVEGIFDQCFKSRKLKGLSRSRILLLTTIHRIIDPGSKRSFSEWAKNTSLPYHLRFNPDDISSQTIWEAMDGITENQIHKAQELLTKRILQIYPTDLTRLHLDYTNYFTFIDSLNGRCVICRRGHNKQKRDDLRQFSMALLTSHKLQVPLVWELYEGNKNDKTEFADFTAFAAEKLPTYGVDPKEIILTFDGGSNSELNFAGLPFSFICAHTMKGLPELYEIDIDEYKEIILRNGHKRQAHEIPEITFSGIEGKGILTYSQDLFDGQNAELEKNIQSFKDACAEIVSSLGHARGKYAQLIQKARKEHETEVLRVEKYNRGIEKELEEKKAKGIPLRGRQKKKKELPVWDEESTARQLILTTVLKGRKHLASFVDVSVHLSAETDALPVISYNIDEEKKAEYTRKYFGKKLICTDQKGLSTVEILSTYTEQECIENLFKVSKDPDHFSVRPQYHWTDQKIYVHVMLCMFAVTIAEVLRKKVEDQGLVYTKEALIEKLATIHDGWILHNMKKADRVVEQLDDEQRALLDIALSLSAN